MPVPEHINNWNNLVPNIILIYKRIKYYKVYR